MRLEGVEEILVPEIDADLHGDLQQRQADDADDQPARHPLLVGDEERTGEVNEAPEKPAPVDAMGIGGGNGRRCDLCHEEFLAGMDAAGRLEGD